MPVVLNNNFSEDTYGIRIERLIAIQPELNAPANIADWADDCADVFSNLLSVSGAEMNESEGATVVVAETEALMEEEYQNIKTLAKALYVDMPDYYVDYGPELPFPERRDDKFIRVGKVLEVYDRHTTEGLTPLLPAAVIQRLSDARDDFQDALSNQDKERAEARHAVSQVSKRFESDTKMLNNLKAWWYAMLGKKDERIDLIGMVNPQSGGGGGTPTPVPPAPTNLVYNPAVPSITWAPVVGATSYEVQHKTDAATEWNIIYTGTDTNLLHGDPVGDYNVKVRARNDGGFGEFSSILNYTVEPIQPD